MCNIVLKYESKVITNYIRVYAQTILAYCYDVHYMYLDTKPHMVPAGTVVFMKCNPGLCWKRLLAAFPCPFDPSPDISCDMVWFVGKAIFPHILE